MPKEKAGDGRILSGNSTGTVRAFSRRPADDDRRAGNHEAVCFKERSFTYGDLDAAAQSWAVALRECGVEPGDRVAIITPEKRAFLAAHLGTLYAGAVSLPLNPRFTREELRYFLADSGAESSWPASSSTRSSSRCGPSCPRSAPSYPTLGPRHALRVHLPSQRSAAMLHA